MAFDPFAPVPPQDAQNPAVPSINPILPHEEDEDEVQFDLTGETAAHGGAGMKEPEPNLSIHLEPIPNAVPKAPDFTAPWEMQKTDSSGKTPAKEDLSSIAVAKEETASNPFALDLGAPASGSATQQPPTNGLIALFERLRDMAEEKTKAFEASQRKHDANIAEEQRRKEEETKTYLQERATIAQGLADLQKKFG